jgi:hypothetical protein
MPTVVPEAMSSNSAAPMERPELIKLSWVQDLCSPSAPGKRFSRHGFLVMIAPDQFNSAQSELADGATVHSDARTDFLWRSLHIGIV